MNADDFKKAARGVTKKWKAVKKREVRDSKAIFNRRMYVYSSRVNFTDAAENIIPEAYLKASGGGTLPAHARQIFYAARGPLESATDRPLKSVYFTQMLLPTYMNRHPETADWKVVYDARGSLLEPHTDTKVPLGTIDVGNYLAEVRTHAVPELSIGGLLKSEFPTKGPKHRYGAILFIEKEGFHPLFEAVNLAERYDLGIMSTKGQSVVAARHLVDELCHGDVPVLVLHDMDKEGFLISQRLTSVSEDAVEAGRVRYEFANDINVIDLGLRLTDVEEWGLESEQVRFKGRFAADTITTRAERQFLMDDQRVELNAFASDDFIKWIEGKLDEQGIHKVVPDDETLTTAYRRAVMIRHVEDGMDDLIDDAREIAEEIGLPGDGMLADRVRSELKDHPTMTWDAAITAILGMKEMFGGDDSAC
jgi:hypothetical protein